MFSTLQSRLEEHTKEFDRIPASRKNVLEELAEFVREKINAHKPVYLNFICTHNSRRSHIAQLWAQAAAHYYGIRNISCFSGGTEATAFNPRAVKAMEAAGFNISMTKGGDNPVYEVRFAPETAAIIAFSKTYDDPFNPNKDFAAIMTCSSADAHCPFVLGASGRIAIPFDDPKEFDGTPQEMARYNETVRQIGREMVYAFSQVKP